VDNCFYAKEVMQKELNKHEYLKKLYLIITEVLTFSGGTLAVFATSRKRKRERMK
jgi:hypothetical protein